MSKVTERHILRVDFLTGLRVSTVLFLVAVASVPFDVLFRVSIVRVTITEMLFVVSLGAWLVEVARRREQVQMRPCPVPVLAIFIVCVLNVFTAGHPLIALRESVQFTWLLVLFYLARIHLRNRSIAVFVVVICLAGGVLASIGGLYQYFFAREPYHFLIAQTRLRAHGFFDQPNVLGVYLVGLIPLVSGFHFLANHHLTAHASLPRSIDRIVANRRLVSVVLLILSGAVAATFSRGSWIALLFSMPILFFGMRGRLRVASFAIVPGLIAAAFTIIVADTVVQPGVIDRSFSLEQRTNLAKAGLAMALDYPVFGIGLGNFPSRLNEYAERELLELMHRDHDETTKKWFVNMQKKPDIELVHNTLIQVAAETGLIGLICFVWVFYSYFRVAIERVRKSVDIEEYCLRVAAIASVSTILVSGMFGWPFSHGVQELLIIVMALAVA